MFALWMVTLGQFIACKGCQETKVQDIDTGAVEEFSNNWGKWLDMTQTPNGEPVIAYYDLTHGALGLATGTLNNGTASWNHEEIDGYPNEQGLDQGDRGAYASLAIDSSGTTWIAYYDASLQTLRYGMRSSESTEWTLGVADSGSGGTPDAGLFSDMALDAQDNPVVAHYDRGRGELRIAHWSDSSFSGEVIDSGEDSEDSSGTISADTGKFASIAISDGFEGQVRPRSGLAFRYGLTVTNAPGTIDSDYRGELKVLLVNLGSDPITIERGMRIAQLVIAPAVQASVSEVATLDETDRGAGGFGSTGV